MKERRFVRSYGLLISVAVIVMVLDQFLKQVVVRTLSGGRAIKLFGGLVWLDFTRNSGAAFGILPSRGTLFAAVALLVSLGIVVFYKRVAASPWQVRTALALILGGALGNLLDRLRLGYVVDFVDLRWWPVFNLADSAIVVGVIVLLIYSVLAEAAQ